MFRIKKYLTKYLLHLNLYFIKAITKDYYPKYIHNIMIERVLTD